MSYVLDNLLKNERILYEAKLHWMVFFTWRSLLTLSIAAWILRSSSEFAVTNRRVMIKIGLIQRRTLELNLSKVESIEVEQTFWGRLLGFGEIEVIGTGGTRERFGQIAAPLEFRKAVHEAAESASELRFANAPQGQIASEAPADPLERIEKAKAMLDKGLISQDEFDSIRQRILAEV